MHIAQQTPAGLDTLSTPAWVSDWWMPAGVHGAGGERADLDLVAGPPEPETTIDVVGRPTPRLDPVRR
jgi:hypothetical protein